MSSPIFAVTVTVILGLMSAVLLKIASAQMHPYWLSVGLIFLAVMCVNFLRFIIWGHIHNRHPVSLSYPLGSIFFPLLLLVSHFLFGETVTEQKLIASLIIMIGVALGTTGAEEQSA
jgi:drug/metabolite transporter (DMT)-like permease